MAYDEDKKVRTPRRQYSTDDRVLGRLHAFSDAVFAIAITILIVSVVIPEGTTKFNLNSVLSALWPNYLAFLISFFVIGIYWIGHVRQFQFIRKYDTGLLWLNLLFLLFIIIIPFTTSLLSRYLNQTSVIIYAANIACVGYMSTLSWFYAGHNYRLIDKKLNSRYIRRSILVNLIIAVIFTVSIGFSFINYNLAQYTWMSVLIFYIIILRIFRLPKSE
jgi:uncharacterized membrane protein